MVDFNISIDVSQMMEAFSDSRVGMVGSLGVNILNDTLLNAGIDFAYGVDDLVTPYSQYVGAGTTLPVNIFSC